jgi:3-oxoacyl-[acyl-carrier protein] reductase
LKTRYALITGSSSGLGLEMCQYLLENGYIVFGASRSGTEIDHENFVDLDVDVTKEESVQEMYDEIGKDTYGLHLIINNAGIYEMGAVVETESEVFSEHLMTNILGPFHILKYGHDFVIEDTTHVINLSSIAGKRGYENTSAYCASKFGFNGLIEACREEWKPLGVRFTTLMPGAIDTPLWNSFGEDLDRDKMLDPEDFLHVFEMVVKSPNNMQFPEITFMHKSGYID